MLSYESNEVNNPDFCTIEHIQPKATGGKDYLIENLALAHRKCNQEKSVEQRFTYSPHLFNSLPDTENFVLNAKFIIHPLALNLKSAVDRLYTIKHLNRYKYDHSKTIEYEPRRELYYKYLFVDAGRGIRKFQRKILAEIEKEK